MSEVVIQVKNLGKRYRIGQRERYFALRDVISEAVRAPFRALAHFGQKTNNRNNFIWALKDVSFEVKHGEVLGVIGRNGAGKSTLLKVLTQITEPTEGRATIRGRVASLLEVGTGFHPELTGRENIYLNGAILGMSKKEIQRKFDEIVSFSEIEEFLDTPAKRYSSGMYVRLAFAVAAHLEPEILLVDEVLAVGDVQFQKKCLTKMGDVAQEGRTVLFVSHNMGAIGELCSRVILLEEGRLTIDGSSVDTIHKYLADGAISSPIVDLSSWDFERTTIGYERFTRLSYFCIPARDNGIVFPRDTIAFRIQANLVAGRKYHLGFAVRNQQGVVLYSCPSADADFIIENASSVEEVEIVFPDIEIAPGVYFVTLWLGDAVNILLDRVRNCLCFEVSLPLDRQYRGKGCIYKVPQWRRITSSE